jgi:hypothetical protein
MGFITNILVFDNIFKKLPKKGKQFKPNDPELWVWTSKIIDSEFDDFYNKKIVDKPSDGGTVLRKNLTILLYSTIEVVMDITSGKRGGAGDDEIVPYDKETAWKNTLQHIGEKFLIVGGEENMVTEYNINSDDILSPVWRIIIDGGGISGWCYFAWNMYTFWVCATDLYSVLDIHLGWELKKKKKSKKSKKKNNNNPNIKALPLPENFKNQLLTAEELEYELEEISLFDGLMRIFKDKTQLVKDIKESTQVDIEIAVNKLIKETIEVIQNEFFDSISVIQDKYDAINQETEKRYEKYGTIGASIQRALNWYHGSELRQIMDDGSLAGQQAFKYKTNEFITKFTFELNQAQDTITNKVRGIRLRTADDIVGLWGSARAMILFLMAFFVARYTARTYKKSERERIIQALEDENKRRAEARARERERERDRSNVNTSNILRNTRGNLRIRTPINNYVHPGLRTPDLQIRVIEEGERKGGRKKYRKKTRKKRRKTRRKSKKRKSKRRRKRKKTRRKRR